jgi:hypothetical protein
MSSLSELTTTSTYWTIRAVESATGISTFGLTPSTTYTQEAYVSTPTAVVVVVKLIGEIEIPLTCDAIYEFDTSSYTLDGYVTVPLVPNPDIAGLGVSRMLGTL